MTLGQNNPSVSVIVPVYNAEDYVVPMMESLLNQTSAVSEILVVDDGSTDRSTELLSQYKDCPGVRLFHQPNSGVSRARNHALSKATSDWIGFLDADDLWDLNKLDVQRPLLVEGVDIVHANSRVVDGNGATTHEAMNHPGHVGSPSLKEQLVQNRFLLHTTLVRRERLQAVGGFDETNRIGAQDFELWTLLIARGAKPVYIDQLLASYRVHGQNYSLDRDRNHRAQLYSLDVLREKHWPEMTPASRDAWCKRVYELCFDTAWWRFAKNQFGPSMGLFARAGKYGPWPTKLKVLGYLAFCCLPFRRWLKKRFKGGAS